MTDKLVTDVVLLLIAAAVVWIVYLAERHERENGTPEPGTSADVAAALDVITDEELISPEQRDELWRVYATRVRTA